MTCPECGAALHLDAQHGEQVCSSCGTVWPLHDISTSTNPVGEAAPNERAVRRGAPELVRHDGKGNPLGPQELERMRRMRRAAKQNAGRHDKRLMRRQNFEHAIWDLARESQTPAWVADDAVALLGVLLQARFVYFPKRRVLAAALLVAALRARGSPVALHEAAATLGVLRAELVRELKVVRRIVPQARAGLDVAAMARSYALRLGHTDAAEAAAELARQWADSNENPLVVAASACLHAARQRGHLIATEDAAQLARVKPGFLRTFLGCHGVKADP